MRKTFPGHYRPTEGEFSILWNTCLFVLDANVLLNLYRYSDRTVKELTDMLTEISERLWVPHQSASEYHRQRLNVIYQQKEAYERIQEGLDKARRQLESDLRIYSRHPLIDVQPLIEKIISAFTNVKEELDKTKEKHPDLIQDDPLKGKITVLLDGKVGPPYSSEKLEEIYKTGEKRYREKVPPGYSDAKKEGIEKYGDLVLWLQIIDKAKETKKPIIFVTDETKEDWWYQFKGQTVGPQPQLVEEMLAKATVSFYMYHTDPFMEYMQKYLEKKIEPKAIEEVRDIREQDERTRDVYKQLSLRLSEMLHSLSQQKLPPSWEVLSLSEKIAKMRESETSQWVKSAIEKVLPSSLSDFLDSDDKIGTVRNYLKSEFPGYTIEDRYDFDRIAQTFRIYNGRTLLVTVSRAFIDDHSVSEIKNILERSHLSNYFQQEGVGRVIVANSGIKLENR